MPNIITKTVTIANAATTSNAVYVGDGELVGIQTDSGYNTGAFTFTKQW